MNIHLIRLNKLANHLSRTKSGGVEWYDFDSFMHGAIGEMPNVWPKVFAYGPEGIEFVNRYFDGYTRRNLREWFSINDEEFNHLFIPGLQKKKYGGIGLVESSTREDFSYNMKQFIEIKLHGLV